MAQNLEIEAHKGNKTLYAKSEIQNEKWYGALLEECSAIITETQFNARWNLIEGYHQLGQRILEEKHRQEGSIYGKHIVRSIAETLGQDKKSRRTIYYAVQFAEKFPDINSLPEGKNISWNKICHRLLPSAPKLPCQHSCRACRGKIA